MGTASGATDRDFDLKTLKDVLDRCGIVITERKPSTSARTDGVIPIHSILLGEFLAKTIQEDLTRLLAPPVTVAAEGPTLICTKHSQLILLC